ncbi:hypothetical protein [Actibacterium sp. D379-3]
MDLILHLGAHRTGSTAFEESLSANAAVLRDEGLVIWPPKVLRRMPGFSRINAPQDQAEVTAAAAALSDGFAAARQAGVGRLLLSEENMIGTMARNLRAQALYGDARARLAAYAAILPQAPRRVALGIRSYTDYWRSAYLYVLRRRALPAFDGLAGPLAQARQGWLDLVAAVGAVFPGAEIVIWPQEALEGRVLETACQVIDRDAGAGGLTPPTGRVNAAPSAADVPLIFRLRTAEPDLANAALDARLADLRGAADDAPVPSFFSADQTRALAGRYDTDIAALAQGHCGARLLLGADMMQVTA